MPSLGSAMRSRRASSPFLSDVAEHAAPCGEHLSHLLPTKLSPPQTTSVLVARDAPLRKLDRGVEHADSRRASHRESATRELPSPRHGEGSTRMRA